MDIFNGSLYLVSFRHLGAMVLFCVPTLVHGMERFTIEWYLDHPAQHFMKLTQCQHDNADSFGISCQNALKAQAQLHRTISAPHSAAIPKEILNKTEQKIFIE